MEFKNFILKKRDPVVFVIRGFSETNTKEKGPLLFQVLGRHLVRKSSLQKS